MLHLAGLNVSMLAHYNYVCVCMYVRVCVCARTYVRIHLSICMHGNLLRVAKELFYMRKVGCGHLQSTVYTISGALQMV